MILTLIGFLTGILSGMGVGGGILLVPLLVIFFDTPQQIAQGTILVSFLLTAPLALYTHFKNGYLRTKLTALLSTTALLGALLGASLANTAQSHWLQKGFAIFLLVMGLYQTFAPTPHASQQSNNHNKK